MDESAILGKSCTYNSSNSTWLRLMQFFPNRTLVHAITYTNRSKNVCCKQLNNKYKDKWVVNLSNRALTDDEQKVLAKGLNYALRPREIPVNNSCCC